MIVIPSRGRPDSLARFFTHSQPTERGVVLLDDDDVQQYQYIVLPKGWSIMTGPRAGYVAWMNRAFERFPNEPWYACFGDDLLCEPLGWDTALARAAGQNFIAYGDDRINGQAASCFPFIGGDLVRRVGWLSYPRLGHLYCDTIWGEIGKGLGLLNYHPEITTEHLHWSVEKQPYDQTAQERPTAGDKETFELFMATEFDDVVTRCREDSYCAI